jgi:hypothetical protein
MRIHQANTVGDSLGETAGNAQPTQGREQAGPAPLKAGKLLGLTLLMALSTHFSACHKPDADATTAKTVPAYTQQPVAETPDHGELHLSPPKKIITPTPQADPWLIAPGVKVGTITPQTALADLQRLYGPANVQAGQAPGPKGTALPGAIVFPGDAKKKLIVYWKPSKTNNKTDSPTVASVLIEGRHSLWHTAEGIKIGTTLTELEHLNGGPFMMSGMDWDYGGLVLSWGDQGKLRDKFQKAGGLSIRLSPPENTHGSYESVVGDKTFSSGNEALQRLNPQVSGITVFLQ